MDDKKHRDLTIPWQESEHIDQILKALDGFNKLTDLLSGEKEVTISSVIPLLRHIYELCVIGEDEDGTLTADIKSSIKKYIALKLDGDLEQNDSSLLMFLRVAEILDPRYLDVSRSQTDVARDWLHWPTMEAGQRSHHYNVFGHCGCSGRNGGR